MDDTSRRLSEIERRLAQLESRLALGAGTAPDESTSAARSSPSADPQTGDATLSPAGPPLVGQTPTQVIPIVPGADVDERGFPIGNQSHTPPPLPARVQAYVGQAGPAELAAAGT